MRHFIAPLILAAATLAFAGPASAQAPLKIGYLDTNRVIQSAPGAEAARATLERELAGFRAQLQVLDDSLQVMATNLQQRAGIMNAEARQREEQAIVAKQAEFQQRADSMQQQAGARQEQLMQPIMTRVEQVISEVRQSGGYAMLFDVAADAIVSADPSLDVTELVIQRLQASGPAAPGQP